MSGTSRGAAKRIAKLRALPGGEDMLKRWASLGGKLSSSRTFATDPELASRAGKKSAEVRRKKRDERLNQEQDKEKQENGNQEGREQQEGPRDIPG